MAIPIIWSPRAASGFESLLTFIREKWGENAAKNLISEVDQVLFQISRLPELYPVAISHLKVRRCVVMKKTLIFYRLRNNAIEILVIADSRQNPMNYRIK